MKTKILVFLSLFLLSAISPLHAFINQYYDSASFQAALGGATLLTQDFEGYAPGTNLSGVDFIPNVNVTTNMGSLEAFSSSGDMVLFGLDGRESGNAYYDINISGYNAVSFYIDAWETYPPTVSGAVDPGYIRIKWGNSNYMDFYFNRPVYDDVVTPVFFGIISDVPINQIRWAEPHESNQGNEETALDDFAVARTQVPEPSTILLLGAGLAGVGFLRRRFKN
jgi:hypothetical protein